jgi:hypothetical protein
MERAKAKQRIIDYQSTFLSEHGCRVLKDMEKYCGLNDVIFCPDNQEVTAFKLGMRAVVLSIRSIIASDVDNSPGRQTKADGAFDGEKHDKG